MTISTNKDATLSNHLKIYINGILHLAIRRNHLVNVQTWINVTNETSVYFIELFYKNGTRVICEYNGKEKWEAIVKAIDNNLD